jgi:hypothetical protein
MRELAMEYRHPQFSREFVDLQQRFRGDLILGEVDTSSGEQTL